jgi:protein-L-isoaspartate(D-aspartate) O-methyltransferase
MDFQTARERLIDGLSKEISDVHVLNAMSRVPREKFVLSGYVHFAYHDRALPIESGQTISQPMIVALMTQALELKGSEKVLEIGTGSGYQTAILAELAETVITVERIPDLADKARTTLKNLGYTNITVVNAGATLGLPEMAPYAAIITTAGAPSVPDELIQQLEIGGRLVIPVGSRQVQELYLVKRSENGTTLQKLGGCRFVPLIGKGAWEDE